MLTVKVESKMEEKKESAYPSLWIGEESKDIYFAIDKNTAIVISGERKGKYIDRFNNVCCFPFKGSVTITQE